MMKPKRAASIEPQLCDCGEVHVYLLDKKGRAFAWFALNHADWIPFGEECARIGRGEEPLGQPKRRVLQ